MVYVKHETSKEPMTCQHSLTQPLVSKGNIPNIEMSNTTGKVGMSPSDLIRYGPGDGYQGCGAGKPSLGVHACDDHDLS